MHNAVATKDLELLEKRLQSEMETHIALLSHTVSKCVEAVHTSRFQKGNAEEPLSHDIKVITIEDVDARIAAFMQTCDQRGELQAFDQRLNDTKSEAIEKYDKLSEAMEIFDQRMQDIVSEALERCEKEGSEETFDHRIKGRESRADNISSAEFSEKMGICLSAIQSMRKDISVWETLLSDFAVQGEQRANIIMQDIEELKRSLQSIGKLRDGPHVKVPLESHVIQPDEVLQVHRQTGKDAVSILEGTSVQTFVQNLRAEVQAKIVAARTEALDCDSSVTGA
jgi:hypothetical protein